MKRPMQFVALAFLAAGIGSTTLILAAERRYRAAATPAVRSTTARQVGGRPARTQPVSPRRPAPRDIVQTAVGPGMQTVTTLVKAVQAADLVEPLRGKGPFTVFAPTNDAFAKLPEGTIESLLKPENKDRLRSILLYHVHAGEAVKAGDLRDGELSTLNGQSVKLKVEGPTVMVNNATVTKTDVMASNGVIHWIDTVIIPEQKRASAAKMTPSRDIIQTAVGPGMQTVTTLVKAVQAAQLVEPLRGKGPFTVFAPTNDAFAKLPASTLETLLKPENRDQLRSILLYHVHAGEAIPSSELKNGQVSTLNGKPVRIKVEGPTVKVDNATVTKTDVMASNGVIHWLDTVILP